MGIIYRRGEETEGVVLFRCKGSVVHGVSFFFFDGQTDKVRQEHSEDMSIIHAISIILERRPDLRF